MHDAMLHDGTETVTVVVTDHFSGPGRAICSVFVCLCDRTITFDDLLSRELACFDAIIDLFRV